MIDARNAWTDQLNRRGAAHIVRRIVNRPRTPRRAASSPRERAPHLPADERRAQIVETALHILARRGVRACTTAALADAAGLSQAALFKHFPSMSAVLDTALRTQAQRMDDWNRAFDAAGARGWPAVAALVRHVLRFLEQANGGPLLMLVIGPVSPAMRRKAQRSMQLLAQRIERLVDDPADAAQMVPFAFAVVQSSTLRWLLQQSPEPPTVIAEPMLRLLDRAFAAGLPRVK